MEGSQILSQTTRESISRMPTNRSSKILKLPEDSTLKLPKSILIHTAGEVKLLLFIEAKSAGSSKWQRSSNDYLNWTLQTDGFLNSYRQKDSITGLKMPKIGVFLGPDTGATQSLFGSLMMEKRLFALAQSPNLRNYQASKTSQTSTKSMSTKSRSHLRRVKACWKESLRSLTAGLRVDLCPTLSATTHMEPVRSSFKKDSQQTSSLKVSIRQEDGFTLWWSSQQQ